MKLKIFNAIKNQTVFIFGGSEGIGLAMAKDCARSGSRLAIFSRNSDKLQKAKNDILSSVPHCTVYTYSCDITIFEAVQYSIKQAIKDVGAPDILLNMAGFAKSEFIENQSLEEYHKMMELNFFGTLYTCKILVPLMIQNKKGKILNTSSMCGFLGLFGYTGYCASKFAVVGFSEALRRELAPYKIQVSVLCPPNTKTPGLIEENKSKPLEVLKTEEKVKVVDAELVSQSALKQFFAKKFMIIPTWDGKLAYYLNRISPRILDIFIQR